MEEGRNEALTDCSKFDAELQAHLEGERRPLIVSHSQACTSCGPLLADLEAIRQVARDLPQEDPSHLAWAKVRAQLEAEGAFAVPGCLQFEHELEACLEGEPRPFITTHACDCASCGPLLADLKAIRQAAQDLPQEEPSPLVWTKVRAKLEAEGALALPACSRFEDELQAYLEGEARPFIVSHSQDCASCGSAIADLQAIQQSARDLPHEEPSRVVWANVRARLEAEGVFGVPASGWRQILSGRMLTPALPMGVLAALVLMGLLLTFPANSFDRKGGTGETSGPALVTQIASPISSGEDRALVHVVSDLEKSFKASEPTMAPDLKATYDKSLVSLDGSIKECLDSLRHEPSNTLAHDYLVTAYTRKAEILSSALEFDGR